MSKRAAGKKRNQHKDGTPVPKVAADLIHRLHTNTATDADMAGIGSSHLNPDDAILIVGQAIESQRKAKADAGNAIQVLLNDIREKRQLILDLGGADPLQNGTGHRNGTNGSKRRPAPVDRKPRLCGICGEMTMHNARTCPQRKGA